MWSISPTSDGSAAAILASESFVQKHNLQARAIEVLALEMATDLPTTFSSDSDCTKIIGFDMTQLAARKAFAKSGITAQQVQVIELHDCFSCNELITYEALGKFVLPHLINKITFNIIIIKSDKRNTFTQITLL